MFCKNCGKELPGGVGFCPECGTKIAGEIMVPTGEVVAVNPCKYMVDANRSLLTYVLLSVVTCGIYSFYFLYKLAADVNVICEGDGKQTPGLLTYILLGFITCGIYTWIWDYSLGNRLAENAPRYGLQFSENGSTILLWKIFGVLLCGIGPFIAMNIIIKNTNALANAYNAK